MKKFVVILFAAALFLTSCGVGSYTVVSGKEDKCILSFTSQKTTPITVQVDGKTYNVQSVADNAYKTRRNIKQTAENSIVMTPGTHDVTVFQNGAQVYSKKLFISNSEHRVIEL